MSHQDNEAVIVETVTQFFHAVESGNWDAIPASLTDPVTIAHGQNQQSLSPRQLASQWQQSHAGFATTRYRLELVRVDTVDGRAITQLEAHVTLTPSETVDGVALTIDGRYTVTLERADHHWRIRSLRHDPTP